MNTPLSLRLLPLCAALLVSLQGTAQQQSHDSRETDTRVPELEAFHSVIFRLWHEAWPERNFALLRELLPEIEEGARAVSKAKLPGILREKETAWRAEVAELQTAVQRYRKACEENRDEALLDAAEELHSQFEALAHLIRPILPEIDDFHKSLYMLYHHYLPEDSLEKVRTSARELAEKMGVLNSATLPKRYAERAQDFDVARAALTASVRDLMAAVKTEERTRIENAVEQVHADYRSLQAVCE